MRHYTLPRLYTYQPLTQNSSIELPAPQAHYLKQVLRLNLADNVLLFNGRDGEWWGNITALEKSSAIIQLTQLTRDQQPEPDIWLCFAPTKNSRVEFISQKATELGVAALQPILTQRTIVTKAREDKMLAQAIEAAEQCERLTVPKIRPIQKLPQLLAQWGDRHIMLCDESGQGAPVQEALDSSLKDKPWAIFIGPEGGFTGEEFVLLRNQPYVTSVGLGPRILRADTAALAALTCGQSCLGDWKKLPDFKG